MKKPLTRVSMLLPPPPPASSVPSHQRKKQLVYAPTARRRNEIDRRYMTSTEKRLKEWHKRKRLPVVCLAFRKGEFWTATGVPQLHSFIKDPVMQQAFFRHFRSGFTSQPAIAFNSSVPAAAAPSEPTSKTTRRSSPPLYDNYNDYRVVNLRRMVVAAVVSDACNPNW
ncbi:uncharacterized protein LOC144647349 [Oculina patagonica]